LNAGGLRPVITIDGVSNYPGFIQNGSQNAQTGAPILGYANISVFNLEVNANNSTLAYDNEQSPGGWIGQANFGTGALNNYIVNCSSNGPIAPGCGGIVGSNSGCAGASLYIIGCSNLNLGTIGDYGGGIVGAYSGSGGPPANITCQYCWSTGFIGRTAGGIFGGAAGMGDGTATAIGCYSLGDIGRFAGGIFGQEAGTCTATNCYSRGSIGTDAGGIFGSYAGDIGPVSATNCYSFGQIYGSYFNPSMCTKTNCYEINGNWNDTSPDNNLTGKPTSSPRVGATWVSEQADQPYELNGMGYTPYTAANITTFPTTALKTIYKQAIQPGQPSSAGIKLGAYYSYTMLSGSDPSMTMDPSTGVITTMASTPLRTYNIVVRNNGSYNTTTFELTLTPPPTPDSNICFPAGTPILTDQGNIPIEKINPKVHTIRNKKIEGIVRTKLMDEYLVCFEKNSLGPNVPCERTIMSGNHKVVVSGQMKMAREFLKPRPFGSRTHSTSIYAVRYNGQPMYNVLMEDYNAMLVNNMVCETLDPANKMADLHAHLKYMSHERQKKLVDKFNTKGAPVSESNPSAKARMKLFQ